jgi:hypothetical protein
MVSLGMAGLTLVWSAFAILTATRGFDPTDEGGYLLSYRWWSENLRTFSGSQYLYGPVFEAIGFDIAGLRIFRLITILAVTAAFGWTFMRWLRPRRAEAPPSKAWELAGTLTIVCCGGMAYSWLPLSPGYNDVSMLGSLLIGAAVLRMATDVPIGVRIAAWVPITAGVVIVGMLLSKWSSSLVVLIVAGLIALILLWPAGPREILRILGWTLGGVVGTLLVIQLLLVPLTEALPAMIATNKLVAATANSPSELLPLYLNSSKDLLLSLIANNFLLLVAAVVAVLSTGRTARRLALAFVLATIGVSLWRIIDARQFVGGTQNLTAFSVPITLFLLVPLLVSLTIILALRLPALELDEQEPTSEPGEAPMAESDKDSASDQESASHQDPAEDQDDRSGWPVIACDSGRTWLMVGLLVMLPVLQGVGTGNPLYFMAVNGFAAWAAVIIFVLTGVTATPVAVRVLLSAVAVGAAITATLIASTSLWLHPYRTAPSAEATVTAPGVSALASLKLAPATATGYASLHEQLSAFIVPEGRYIMAFDEIPGVVLALDGRPVGEAWYSASDPSRTAANIRAECPAGQGPWGARRPLLLFDRTPTDTEFGALEACGLSFVRDYRLLGPPEATSGLAVFVPKADARTEPASSENPGGRP